MRNRDGFGEKMPLRLQVHLYRSSCRRIQCGDVAIQRNTTLLFYKLILFIPGASSHSLSSTYYHVARWQRGVQLGHGWVRHACCVGDHKVAARSASRRPQLPDSYGGGRISRVANFLPGPAWLLVHHLWFEREVVSTARCAQCQWPLHCDSRDFIWLRNKVILDSQVPPIPRCMRREGSPRSKHKHVLQRFMNSQRNYSGGMLQISAKSPIFS